MFCYGLGIFLLIEDWEISNYACIYFTMAEKKINDAHKQFLLLPENTEKLSAEVRDGDYFLGSGWFF